MHKEQICIHINPQLILPVSLGFWQMAKCLTIIERTNIEKVLIFFKVFTSCQTCNNTSFCENHSALNLDLIRPGVNLRDVASPCTLREVTTRNCI